MYEYITGRIDEATPAYAVVEAAGVGYFINISLHTYSKIERQTEAKIYTHYIVREDAQILYGFASRQERELFRLLISVSGVGGNTARMVLSTYSPSELVSIIGSGNAALLKNVKGLGLKTAQKIIVELKDKIAATAVAPELPAQAAESADTASAEAVSALVMLGFPKAASEKAVKSIRKQAPSLQVEEIVKLALKSYM
ncbi:MAG: Holliday junction branch migration protein RuvA [Rikenellaceae bacterium]|nr:Holliday junction branch migration protein RuvA [Rikenellaceae bacterium]